MTSGIYVITSNINNKKYIGCTNDFKRRFNEHLLDLIKEVHYNRYIQNHYNKYKCSGKDVFNFDILEKTTVDKIQEREIYYINKFNTTNKLYGFNLTTGGEDLANPTKEFLINKRNAIISKLPPVYCYTINGGYIGEFKCVPDIAESLGLNKNSVMNALQRGIQLKGYLFYKNKKDFSFYSPNIHGTNLIILNTDFDIVDMLKGMKNAESKYNININSINNSCNRLQLCHKKYYFIRAKDISKFEDKYKTTLSLLDNEPSS